MPLDRAMNRLRLLPFEDLGFAKVDHHRTIRRGFPEVIFSQGKTADQVVAIIKRMVKRNSNVLATRATPAIFAAVRKAVPTARYHEAARLIEVVSPSSRRPRRTSGAPVLVVTAGTADIPVAEEAAVTAEWMGSKVERLYDVGVAGIHRLLGHQDLIRRAGVIVVVAGMEGALASVVGGLVDKPVIAVPTSVGYGASFEGLAALLGMLNSCASGVVVVNIDNGFGAGYFAGLINRPRGKT